jgi:hypothetical protein
MTLPSLADFDGYCEEHDVQSGQYGVALAQWLANIAGRPMTGELADGQGATFTAEPEGVDSSTWLAGGLSGLPLGVRPRTPCRSWERRAEVR